MLGMAKQVDVSLCHGCGLCALVCPVYQQGGNVMQVPHGLAKVRQAGEELNHDDVMACILCGACASICPQPIDMMQMLIELRREAYANNNKLEELPICARNEKDATLLIADQYLLAHDEYLQKVLDLLGSPVQLASDHANDISEALLKGLPVSHARVHQFLTSLQSVRNIIVSDGLLYQVISEKLPQVPVQLLGQVLSSNETIRAAINDEDLYVMDSRCYHASYDMAVLHYDRLHKQRGCQLNRDLHRLAISIGECSTPSFNQQKQIDWLLEGRDVRRIVVESVKDYGCLSDYCKQPVVHLAELADEVSC